MKPVVHTGTATVGLHKGAFTNEIGAELLKAIRAPEFILPTLIMPSAFYAFFGVILNQGGNTALYLLATYGVFAVMGPAIFGFGVGVATERDRGWLQLKKVSPAPAYYYVAAKMITTLIFAACALLPIYLIAGFAGGVSLERATWFGLFALHLCAAVPFGFIGLTLGFKLSSGGAIALSNTMYFTLAIFGGLWMPVFIFPNWMQGLAHVMPSYHLAELALTITSAPGDHSPLQNLITLLCMTLLLAGIAIRAWSNSK